MKYTINIDDDTAKALDANAKARNTTVEAEMTTWLEVRGTRFLRAKQRAEAFKRRLPPHARTP